MPGEAEQADLVLRLPPKQRLQFLIEGPKPMALVRALPDGDFYTTVREVDPQEALPLLALASSSQIAHLLDLESWRGDRFDPLRCGAWVALLVEAGEATIRRFARTIDDETLILLFRTWARVRPLEIDHEEPTRGHGITEIGDDRGFVAPDGAHVLVPERSEHALAARRLAEVLFLDDRSRYSGIVRSALFELPSEVEETALRWRSSRLEEHGYPSWDDAQSIYVPPADSPSVAAPPPEPPTEALVAPRSPLRAIAPHAAVLAAVNTLGAAERERVLFGLNALANRVLVADGADAGSTEARKAVLARTGAYVALALERRGAKAPAEAAGLLASRSAVELFREGYAESAALQSRARKLAVPEAMIDPPLRTRVRLLLGPRPLHVDLAAGEGEPQARDFRTLAEIEETRATLELIETLGAVLLERRGTTAAAILAEEPRPFEDRPRLSTLLLTALAWHAATGEIRIDRLPSDRVADFLRVVASRRTADADAPSRAMERLLEALRGEAPIAARPSASMRAFAIDCLDTLAADCAQLDPGTPATPRVIGCLRLA